MNGGANIVQESREGEFFGARAAADRLLALDHEHGPAGLRERDRGGEAVGPGADHDIIVFSARRSQRNSPDGKS